MKGATRIQMRHGNIFLFRNACSDREASGTLISVLMPRLCDAGVNRFAVKAAERRRDKQNARYKRPWASGRLLQGAASRLSSLSSYSFAAHNSF